MTDCPCCSGIDFEECCSPILNEKKAAPTAEALMRSRYTAYANGHFEHILRSMHPKHRKEFDEDAARTWSEKSDWQGLEIVSCEAGGEDDTEGVVEFIASYSQDGEQEEHHEIAEFSRVDNKWYFVDGKIVGNEPYIRPEPKVGRNEPCPCGSGKKYKKCCGR
ncbi:MAG: YchJ family protein [Proteobacteria bacterium]|nr:YchJ family protein [Pseudomonadota bacterium]